MAQRKANSQVSTQATTGDDNKMMATETVPTATLLDHPSKGTRVRPNIFQAVAIKMTETSQNKMALMGTVRQKLAEAYDLFKSGDDRAKEATAIAEDAALRLYQARAASTVNPEEVSAILGDVFGYKPKSDGTPGKTPAGQGEAIRKRVVRAYQAFDHLANGNGSSFFEGLDGDSANKDGLTLSEVVNGLDQGSLSIWTAYEKFAEIKREHTTRTDAAFDPKKIAAIVGSLSGEGAVDMFREMPDLVRAYAALIDILQIVGEEAAKPLEEAA